MSKKNSRNFWDYVGPFEGAERVFEGTRGIKVILFEKLLYMNASVKKLHREKWPKTKF